MKEKMFEILRLISLGTMAKMGVDVAKGVGLLPVNMLSVSSGNIKWLRELEFRNWLSAATNPSSSFFKAQNIGDGVLTVGWGLTNQLNSIYPSDCKITHLNQVFNLNQLERMEKVAHVYFENIVKNVLQGLNVPQGVFDSLVSGRYNAGSLFKDGTQFIYHLKRGEFDKAVLHFDWWQNPTSQFHKGLVIRRMVEHSIWYGKQPKSFAYYETVWQQYRDTRDKNLL